MDIDFKLIGKRIASIRKSKNLTQEKLSEATGITNNFLSHIERSHSIPSLETLIKICEALDVTPDTILLGVKKDDKKYLNDDILDLMSHCSPKQKRVIIKLIETIIKEKLE